MVLLWSAVCDVPCLAFLHAHNITKYLQGVLLLTVRDGNEEDEE